MNSLNIMSSKKTKQSNKTLAYNHAKELAYIIGGMERVKELRKKWKGSNTQYWINKGLELETELNTPEKPTKKIKKKIKKKHIKEIVDEIKNVDIGDIVEDIILDEEGVLNIGEEDEGLDEETIINLNIESDDEEPDEPQEPVGDDIGGDIKELDNPFEVHGGNRLSVKRHGGAVENIWKVSSDIIKNIRDLGMMGDSLKISVNVVRADIEEYPNEKIHKIRNTKFFRVIKIPANLFVYNRGKNANTDVRMRTYKFVNKQLAFIAYDFLEKQIKKYLKITSFEYKPLKGYADGIDIELDFGLARAIRIPSKSQPEQKFKLGLYNCVIQAIKKQSSIKNHIFTSLNKKFLKSGVSYKDFDYISTKTLKNFRVRDIMGNIKFELIKYEKRKIIELTNNASNHVSTYKRTLFDCMNKKDKIETTQEDINDMYCDTKNDMYSIAKILINTNEGNIGSVITNDTIYYTKENEEEQSLMTDFYNNFTNNEYIDNTDMDLYNFSANAVHYPSCHMNKYREKVSADYITIDKNKAYGSFNHNKLYNKFKFPSGLCGIYKNNKQSTTDIIEINGISRIANVNFSLCDDNMKKYFNNINLIENDKNYTHPFLYDMYHTYQVRFDITFSAISVIKKDFKYTKEQMEKKFYKICYGTSMADKDFTTFKMHGTQDTLNLIVNDLNKTDVYQAHYMKEEYIPLEPNKLSKKEIDEGYIICDDIDSDDEDDDFDYEEASRDQRRGDDCERNEINIVKKKDYKRNLSYFSAYVASYSLIEIIDKISKIPYDEVIKIKCDGITTLRKHKDLFEISTADSGWKLEENRVMIKDPDTEFIMSKYCDVDYDNIDYYLSNEKLQQTQFNLTSGEAGTGKSTSQYVPFDTDQRHKNALYLYPTKDLAQDFAEKYKIDHITYQKFIVNGFEMNKDFFFISKFKNLIIDECTFPNQEDMEKIKQRAIKYNFVIHFIGDLDEKRIYQLQAVDGVSINMDFMKKTFTGLYHRHLTKVHRNGGVLLSRLNKIRKENLSNDKIIELFKDRIISPKNIKYKVGLENIFLAPLNRDVAKYNSILYNSCKNDDYIIQKDPKTNHKRNEINNKRRLKRKKDFEYTDQIIKYHKNLDNDDYKQINNHLGFAITSHLSQGKTYKGQLYIRIKNLYTENLLYVMLSRATDINNIHIIL